MTQIGNALGPRLKTVKTRLPIAGKRETVIEGHFLLIALFSLYLFRIFELESKQYPSSLVLQDLTRVADFGRFGWWWRVGNFNLSAWISHSIGSLIGAIDTIK